MDRVVNRASCTQVGRAGRSLRLATAVLAIAAISSSSSVTGADESEATTLNEQPITADDREHWSFRPLSRPSVPHVSDPAWPRNAIDRFILARLDAAGLQPMPPADRRTLIRRLTLDLTGLPPTPAEIEEFRSDTSPDAYGRLVDRLLASPAYGERWAQHWLDLARFAETDGFELDKVRPHAWRYRDWVINAINDGMPYDEFIRLQIAGDLFQPDDPDARIATGFLLCGPDMTDINLLEERRHVFLNDMTGTVASALLGLNMGCAQCHDHKFDPVSQLDFYRLRAFFENTDLFRDHTIATPAERDEHNRRVAEHAARLAETDKQIRDLLKQAGLDGDEESVDSNKKPAKKQTDRRRLIAKLNAIDRQRYARLEAELKRLERDRPADLPMGRIMKANSGPPTPAFFYVRGDFRRKGPEVSPAFPRIVSLPDSSLALIETGTDAANRRAALADWLTQPDHRLTTRVIVNRLWQHHFGRGLSASSSNFGIMGDEPTHPELLDWLAETLVDQNWSLKQMHRLLITSATYRQASRRAHAGWREDQRREAERIWQESQRLDSENELLGRMPRRRLEGEAIRDSMLAAAGILSQRRGGPGVRPPLPPELVVTLLKDQWPVTPDEADHRRRSIYLFVRRNLRFPIFDVFDKPDTNESCAKRNRSTTAPQALTLLNSNLSLLAARHLAGRALQYDTADPGAQIEQCYLQALARPPTDEERALAVDFVKSEADRLKAAGRDAPSLALPPVLPDQADIHHAAALTTLCLAIFNLNEFVYVD